MKQDAAGSKRQSMKSPPHFYTLTCIIGFGNAKYLWEERKVQAVCVMTVYTERLYYLQVISMIKNKKIQKL